jgi:hypothetical protein
MQPRLILALLITYAGSTAALVDIGPAVGFDSRPPGEGDGVFGLSLTACLGPASVCVRGVVMPTDTRESSGGSYVDEWERRYYSADVTPLVAFGAEAVAPVAGVNYRQSRYSDYDYEGGVRQIGVPTPFTYTDGETTTRRILAVGGVKFGDDEGLTGAAWGGVGVGLHERTGTAWTESAKPEFLEPKRATWSLDAEWKTLEFAAAAAATYRVVKYFGITGGFEVSNRIRTLDDDAPSQRPVGFALFFAPVLQL